MNKPPTNPTPFDGYEIPDIKLSTDLTDDSYYWSPKDNEWLSAFSLSDATIEGMILVDARFCRKIQPATKQEPQTEYEHNYGPLESGVRPFAGCRCMRPGANGSGWVDVPPDGFFDAARREMEAVGWIFAKPFTPESEPVERTLQTLIRELATELEAYDREQECERPVWGAEDFIRKIRPALAELQALADKEKPEPECVELPLLAPPTVYDLLDEIRTNYGYVHDDLQVPVSLQNWAESVTKLLGVLAQGSQK